MRSSLLSIALVLSPVALTMVGCSDSEDVIVTKPEEDASLMARVTSDDVLATVMAATPDGEARVLAAIEQSRGAPVPARWERVRQVMLRMTDAHLRQREGHMDDETVVLMARTMAAAMVRRLEGPDAENCRTPRAWDDSYTKEERATLLSRMVRADPTFRPVVGTMADASSMLNSMVDEVALNAGLPVETVRDANDPGVQVPASVSCRVSAAAMTTLAALPSEHGAPLLRAMHTF